MLSRHLLAEHGWSCQLPIICWSSSHYSGHSFSGVPGFCPDHLLFTWVTSFNSWLQILSSNFTDDSRISNSRPDSFSDSLTNIPNSLLNSPGGFPLALLTHQLPLHLQTCSFSRSSFQEASPSFGSGLQSHPTLSLPSFPHTLLHCPSAQSSPPTGCLRLQVLLQIPGISCFLPRPASVVHLTLHHSPLDWLSSCHTGLSPHTPLHLMAFR